MISMRDYAYMIFNRYELVISSCYNLYPNLYLLGLGNLTRPPLQSKGMGVRSNNLHITEYESSAQKYLNSFRCVFCGTYAVCSSIYLR